MVDELTIGFPLFPSLVVFLPLVFHFYPPLAINLPLACIIQQVRVVIAKKNTNIHVGISKKCQKSLVKRDVYNQSNTLNIDSKA